MAKLTLSSVSTEFTKEILTEIYHSIDDSCSYLEMEDYVISSVGRPGQGFVCDVFGLEIIRKTQRFYFIVKVLFKNKIYREISRSAILFQRQIYFYNNVLPKFLLMQKLTGAKNNFQNDVLQCYKAFKNGSDDFIVFNDLSKHGYASPNVSDGLTREETYKAVEVLAKFHSMSMAFKKIYSNEFYECAKATKNILYCSSNKSWLFDYVKRIIEIAENVVIAEVGPDSEMLTRFKKFMCGNFYERLVHFNKLRSRHSVVCNGDAQASNFMFSSNGAKLLDFQMARFSSPMADLFFLLYTSLLPGLLAEQYNNILNFYYRTMGNYLADMGVAIDGIFSKNDFALEVEKYACLGLANSFNAILMSVQEKNQYKSNFSFDRSSNVSLIDFTVVNFPSNRNVRRRLICALQHAIENGFI